MIKRILLVGGTSLIGKHIIQTAETQIISPDRKSLDLTDPDIIRNYDYKNFDCLILVAGAGMTHGKTINFDSMDDKYIKNTIDVNCTGSTLLLNRYLKTNKKGHVVIIGSRAIYKTDTPNVVYTASKVYLDRLVDILEKTYTDTRFIKINPAKVSSRFEHKDNYIRPEQVASSVWHCIANNIKKLDITYKI